MGLSSNRKEDWKQLNQTENSTALKLSMRRCNPVLIAPESPHAPQIKKYWCCSWKLKVMIEMQKPPIYRCDSNGWRGFPFLLWSSDVWMTVKVTDTVAWSPCMKKETNKITWQKHDTSLLQYKILVCFCIQWLIACSKHQHQDNTWN